MRIVQLSFKNGFTPVDKNVFKLGTTINFDCYIERFNGLAVMVEKETLLDEKIYTQIINNDLQIFIKTDQYANYKDYNLEFNASNSSDSNISTTLNLDEETVHCYHLGETLTHISDASEKLKVIYLHAKNLLNAWIVKKNERSIPLDAFNKIVESLIYIIKTEKITLSKFKDFLDAEYSLASHLIKVSFFAALIGSHIKHLITSDLHKLTLAALMHDIGMSSVDPNLLDKPDLLTKDELNTIKKHTEITIKLLMENDLKDRAILNAIKEHHEKLDGSGYPYGLMELRISEFGKILAVCDVFDALITIKPYRGAYSTMNALRVIQNDYKNKLDMQYVTILIKHLT